MKVARKWNWESGEFEGFDGDGVWSAAGGENGEQGNCGGANYVGGADDSDVGGAGIDDKEQEAVAREC